jgi:hypothetical protein
VEYLQQFSCLEGLMLDECAVTDAGLLHLKNLRALKDLGLSGTDAGDASVEMAATRFSLCRFSLGKNSTDASLPWLCKMTSLNDLEIIDSQVTDEGILRWMPQLERMELHSLGLKVPGLSDMVLGSFNPRFLRELRCSDLHGSREGMAVIGRMSQLELLSLGNMSYHDSDLCPLRNMHHLRYLSLHDETLTDPIVPLLESIPNLESISLHSVHVSKHNQKWLIMKAFVNEMRQGGDSEENIRKFLATPMIMNGELLDATGRDPNVSYGNLCGDVQQPCRVRKVFRASFPSSRHPRHWKSSRHSHGCFYAS